MKFLSIFLLFIPSLFATGWDNTSATSFLTDFPIYLYGDIAYIEQVFNAVAMIAGSDAASYLSAFGLGYVAIISGFDIVRFRTITPAVKNAAFSISALILLLFPGVSVHLIDERVMKGYVVESTETYAKVDNIPYFIAATGSLATAFKVEFTDLVDDVLSPLELGPVSFASLGYSKSFEIANTILKDTSLKNGPEGLKLYSAIDVYTSDCLLEAMKAKPRVEAAVLGQGIINPKDDWFAANAPATLGIVTEGMEIDGAMTTCGDFWTTSIQAQLPAAKDEFMNFLQKRYPSIDMNITAVALMKSTGMGQNYKDTVINPLASLQQAGINYGAGEAITNAIKNKGSGLTGLELANQINVDSARWKLKTEGLGQFKWMAEIIPSAVHFFEGVIYCAAILMILMVVYLGWERGKMWLFNYASGLLIFESSIVSLAISDNLVKHYAADRAIDRLADINPMSISGSANYMDYMSTMTGLSGVLGVAAIFLIPTIIFGGKVANTLGSISSLQGLMQSNMDAARQIATHAKSANDFKNDQRANPTGMLSGAAESYNQYRSEIDSFTSGLAFSGMRSGDYMNAQVNNVGFDLNKTIARGGQARNANGQIASNSDHQQAGAISGMLEGTQAISGAQGSASGLEANGGINSYAKGVSRHSELSTRSVIGAGNASYTQADRDAAVTAGAINFESGNIKNRAQSAIFGNTSGTGMNDKAKEAAFASSVDGFRRQIASGTKLSESFNGDISSGKNRYGQTNEQVINAEAQKDIDSRMGTASGISKNILRKSDGYSTMAEFAETKSFRSQLGEMRGFNAAFGNDVAGMDNFENVSAGLSEKSGQIQIGQNQGFRANQKTLGRAFATTQSRIQEEANAQSFDTAVTTAHGENSYLALQKQTARLGTLGAMSQASVMGSKGDSEIMNTQTGNMREHWGIQKRNAELVSGVQGQNQILENLRANGVQEGELYAKGLIDADGNANRKNFAESYGALQAGSKMVNIGVGSTMAAISSSYGAGGGMRTQKVDTDTSHPGAALDAIGQKLGIERETMENIKGASDIAMQFVAAGGAIWFAGKMLKSGTSSVMKEKAGDVRGATPKKEAGDKGTEIAKRRAINKNVEAKADREAEEVIAEKVIPSTSQAESSLVKESSHSAVKAEIDNGVVRAKDEFGRYEGMTLAQTKAYDAKIEQRAADINLGNGLRTIEERMANIRAGKAELSMARKEYLYGAEAMSSNISNAKSELVEQVTREGARDIAKVEGGMIARESALTAGKKIPFVGAAIGAGMAVSDALAGDFVGAGMNLASGAVSMVPGIGTAASFAIDGANAARQMGAFNGFGTSQMSAAPASSLHTSPTQVVSQPMVFTQASAPIGMTPSLVQNAQLGAMENITRQLNVQNNMTRSTSNKIAESGSHTADMRSFMERIANKEGDPKKKFNSEDN